MTYHIKMCSFSLGGYMHPCMECKFMFDPVGCRSLRKLLHGKIVYPIISDRLADIPVCDFLGCQND